jgi:hypothetical protein
MQDPNKGREHEKAVAPQQPSIGGFGQCTDVCRDRLVPPTPAAASVGPFGLPRVVDGRLGADIARLSWRARMRWLDDGGR